MSPGASACLSITNVLERTFEKKKKKKIIIDPEPRVTCMCSSIVMSTREDDTSKSQPFGNRNAVGTFFTWALKYIPTLGRRLYRDAHYSIADLTLNPHPGGDNSGLADAYAPFAFLGRGNHLLAR